MATDLSTLLIDVSYAAHRERWHQESCRANREDDFCQACLDYEAAWLAADRALDAFQRDTRLAAAS